MYRGQEAMFTVIADETCTHHLTLSTEASNVPGYLNAAALSKYTAAATKPVSSRSCTDRQRPIARLSILSKPQRFHANDEMTYGICGFEGDFWVERFAAAITHSKSS